MLDNATSALNFFTAGTVCQDSGPLTSNLFTNSTDADFVPIASTVSNLDTFGEVSFCLNLTRLVDRATDRAHQEVDTSIRVHGRFGDNIRSVGVTAQLRVQF